MKPKVRLKWALYNPYTGRAEALYASKFIKSVCKERKYTFAIPDRNRKGRWLETKTPLRSCQAGFHCWEEGKVYSGEYRGQDPPFEIWYYHARCQSDGVRVNHLIPILFEIEVRGDCIIGEKKEAWSEMRIVRVLGMSRLRTRW